MRFAIAVLFLLAYATAKAAPFAVQVGDGRIALDAPPGFADTGFTGSPRLQELAESLTSASNRVLLFALSDLDLRRFTMGDQIEARRYMVAVTPRGLEHERVTAETFAALVADALRGFGKPPAPGDDHFKFLEAQGGAPAILAELKREPGAVSILQGTRVAPQNRNDKPQYALSTTTLLLLRGKALGLTVHGVYENADDLHWIRAITLRWIEELQRLNSR